MSESAWARCIACGEMCGHAETSVVDAELERLRAENAELRAELDWFRRREPLTRSLFDDPDDSAVIAFGEWETANPKPNPKPGAGT